MNRTFNILLSALALIVFVPGFVVVAVMVVCSSPGPVFFRQQRVGRNGRDFTLYKFRTMRVSQEAETGIFDAGSRERVTEVGRFLRKTKVDELPQLWNVLRGDMSLVGPRPEVRKWTEVYPERWALVHTVRPGITDPASIVFRNEEEILAASPDPENTYRFEILPKKLEMYEEYVKCRSFTGDLKLIFRTLISLLKGSA